jgi:hypothetical protein
MQLRRNAPTQQSIRLPSKYKRPKPKRKRTLRPCMEQAHFLPNGSDSSSNKPKQAGHRWTPIGWQGPRQSIILQIDTDQSCQSLLRNWNGTIQYCEVGFPLVPPGFAFESSNLFRMKTAHHWGRSVSSSSQHNRTFWSN